MNPLNHRFSFFPMGTPMEIEVLPFLGVESRAVVALPPLSREVFTKIFEGVEVILDGKRVVLFVINDSIFNEMVTNQIVLDDIVSSTKNNFSAVWFIGLENKLAILANYFLGCCSKKEDLYFHSPNKKDVTYSISKRYKNSNCYVYRLIPIGPEHLTNKN
ncbi:MAG: hypothetical protein QG674_308 [Patescibacteria group bacterium]|nr:hypothetical protein [Patescibacteria group bacterium]